ncbi:biopolymer transporter ExbD [Alcaligenaceae bacterium A4P071]|nr:biopolymer transporter ExbD [Alcaligenaceae bacterium B3P038]MDQ2187957.1 biopolymer transporter ExbD [Alcaligenaceae bacterium A4P071]
MNFRPRRRADDTLDINLVPLIDVLLVMVIFFAATTTFTRDTALSVALPQARSEIEAAPRIELAISHDGRYALNGALIDPGSTDAIAQAMRGAIVANPAAVLLVRADGQASHQSVVTAMEAARLAGISRVDFAAQRAP